MKNSRATLGLVIAVIAVLLWWMQGNGNEPTGPDDPTYTPSRGATPQSDAGGTGRTDPDSGLPWVAASALPPEAGDTMSLIDAGGPFPHEEDGATFQNREGVLPDERRGYYKEHTVETPGSDDRGARRIVTGATGELYWTDDHHRSFERIRR